ncbi:stress enhanced protein 1, chloroplastic-like [Lolium rigidum]|uniref:stress enhanced protein 1, chloroplastic-like n=1 Tax=Lolium rigidum TaxID=89674 RepID=UPI001F5DCF0E|nr:stress enhanced protein 1, chloroplastic-like [Lolium rigidum]
MAFISILRSSPVAVPAACSRRPALRSNHGAYLLRVSSRAAPSLSVRCEQSGKQGASASAVDVWASRLAMMSFAAAVVSEVSTGKGFVENFGVPTPAPALAIVVTALVGGLAVLFITRSGSQQ